MAPGRPHLLYVAWGFPPCRSGGVYRALATVNAFAAAGWDVTVITADRRTFERYTGADASLEDRVHPSVEVLRVPFAWPTYETDLRQWSWFRARSPRVWREYRNRADRLRFPESGYGPWRSRIEQAAVELHRRHPVDLTVASANPSVDFTPAVLLHRKFGVPYVMDYRDAWLLDVFGGGLLHGERSRAARLERSYVKDAAEVWFVNEPIAQWHRQRYPHKAAQVHVVANGYDPEFAPTPRAELSPADRPLVFGYIGTVSGKVPLKEFLEGWRLARGRDPLLAQARAEIHGYLGFYATQDPRMAGLLEEFRELGVNYHGPVAKADIAATYQRFDALLLLLGSGRYVTSGKAYEYVASGLPVAAVHDPINAAADVFRDYPRWFPVQDLSPEQVAGSLEAAARSAVDARAEDLAQVARVAQGCSRDLQLRPRIEALRALVDARRGLAPSPSAAGRSLPAAGEDEDGPWTEEVPA